MANHPSSFLLGLPNELHAMIFEDQTLSDSDLASLRATCHHIKSFATPVLGKRRYVKVVVRYSEEGLEQFSDLAASEMASFVRSVRFSYRSRLMNKRTVKRSATSDYSGIREIIVAHSSSHVGSLKEVLRGANHLEALRIRRVPRVPHEVVKTIDYTISYPIDQALKHLSSDQLSAIKMDGTVVSADVLPSLLTRHRQTVASLGLCRCTLVEGRWISTLVWIQLNMTSLQALHLQDLSLAVVIRAQRRTRHDFDTTAGSQATHRVFTSTRYPEGKLEGIENIQTVLSSMLVAYSREYEVEVEKVKKLMAAQEMEQKARNSNPTSSRVLRSRCEGVHM